ncbi:MAG: tyrosine-type recombinase/integrase, partial [Acidimicrobiales bacterium]
MRLETGQWTWSSALSHRHLVSYGLSEFCSKKGIEHPQLCADAQGLRAFALELASFVRSRRPSGRSAKAGSLQPETHSRICEAVAQFYAFMADYRQEAATALADERWASLTDAHARLFRPAEIGRRGRAIAPADDKSYIAEGDLARMFAHIELLGLARSETRSVVIEGEVTDLVGLGDPSAMRAWMLQALTARRASEILLMGFDPILPVPGLDPAGLPEDAMVARLAYGQTKIAGAPSTILVGADVVALVAEQQAFVRERYGLSESESAPYLFPRLLRNPRGTWPRSVVSYLCLLERLDKVLCLLDSEGRPLCYSRSHRLRHTKATTLLNLGAPVHVVMRYLGQRSPEMAMRYSQTLASTAEREFLALAKIGRDGRELQMDRQDLLDLVGLERRADRILPNGYCLLPPTKCCDKGNACHTCDNFATDASYLPEIRRQAEETEALVARRQAQHLVRYGEEMSESNVWLAQRRVEIAAMALEIAALESLDPESKGSALRGAGVLARPGYSAAPVRLGPPTRR